MHLAYLILEYYNMQLMDTFNVLIYQLKYQLRKYLLVLLQLLDHMLLYIYLSLYY